MELYEILWKSQYVEKLEVKHGGRLDEDSRRRKEIFQ